MGGLEGCFEMDGRHSRFGLLVSVAPEDKISPGVGAWVAPGKRAADS